MKKNRSKSKSGAESPVQNTAVSAPAGPRENSAPAAQARSAGGVAAESGNGNGIDTIVEAKIDIGFGNQLFIRGGGAGLSWGEGKVLDCADPATWVFKCQNVSEPFEFKLLINDQNWCIGANYTVQPGATMQVIPHFVS